ncbi:GHKL domain-containing protein [Romboutsia sedimentorum]|uniref:sensor histidine kinase n=1 Tax=Romboutsia sedimentorum TaxID=1368474 RepID=UPI0024DE0E9E|nr:sensor histidine kinase [Romboutsia sedimentorum]MDK2586477.1 GHKL domain-containing protein [Romboutsia sedimentorum]
MSLVIGITIVGHFSYNNSKAYKLRYFIFAVCLFICDVLSTLLINIIVSTFDVYIMEMAYYQIILVISIRLMEFIYVKLSIVFMNRYKISKLKLIQLISFIMVPFFSIFYIFTLLNYVQIYSGEEDIILFIFNVLSIFAVNIYVTHIFDNISKNNILENEINLYVQQSKLQYKYYDNLERKYQESRKLAHDIRNHLNTIEELYKCNDVENAKQYTDDIHSMLNELNQKYYSSNRVLNIILNDKFEQIKNINIKLEYRIGDVDIDFIREIDITTIFANLLDNAIEATANIKYEGYIKLDIDKFNDFLVINISNSMIEKPIHKGKKLKSTKENHQGLGIENIKKSLERYDGTILIDYSKDEFKVNIVIPI